MSTVTLPQRMTAAEFLALPDDGVERMLIRGELRVLGEETKYRRNYRHSRTSSRITHLLEEWLDAQPEPRGEILCGDAAFQLRQDSTTMVGIDVAYISAEMRDRVDETTFEIEGPPVLAVEILSPSDKNENIQDKVAEYLDCGVALVWVVDPKFRTVTVYRPDAEPVLFNRTQTITGEPHLPGLSIAVDLMFSRQR